MMKLDFGKLTPKCCNLFLRMFTVVEKGRLLAKARLLAIGYYQTETGKNSWKLLPELNRFEFDSDFLRTRTWT